MIDLATKRLTLGVLDRLTLMNVLPNEGGLVTMRVAKDARKKLGFSQAEQKEAEFKDLPGGRLEWNDDYPEKEMVFTEAEYKMLKDKLKELADKEKLTPQTLEVYEKIMGNKDEEKEA
jgi:hypothetical protein